MVSAVTGARHMRKAAAATAAAVRECNGAERDTRGKREEQSCHMSNVQLLLRLKDECLVKCHWNCEDQL